MERLFLVSALIAVVSQVTSGDIPVHMTVTPNQTLQVSPGSTIAITCKITQNINSLPPSVPFVDVWHVSSWNGKRIEKKMFEQTSNQPDVSPEFYTMSSLPGDQLVDLTFTLTVHSVRRIDDGRFEFRMARQNIVDLYPLDDGIDKFPMDDGIHEFPMDDEESNLAVSLVAVEEDIATKSNLNYSNTVGIDVVVLADLTFLFITSKCNNSIVTGNDVDILDLDDGDTMCVSCEAGGSNPATRDLIMFFGDDPLASGPVIALPMTSSDVRQYTSLVDSEHVVVTPLDDGKAIQCNARMPSGKEMMSQMIVRVRTFRPSISCRETLAYPDQTSVQFDCFVDRTNVSIHIMQYKFYIGDRGVTLHVRDIDYSVVTVLDDLETEAKVERIKDGSTTYIDHMRLTLSTASLSHFSTDFSLVVESESGHLTRHAITLHQTEKPTTTMETITGETSATRRVKGAISASSDVMVSMATIALAVSVVVMLGRQ